MNIESRYVSNSVSASQCTLTAQLSPRLDLRTWENLLVSSPLRTTGGETKDKEMQGLLVHMRVQNLAQRGLPHPVRTGCPSGRSLWSFGARKACLLPTKASLPMLPYSSGYSLSDLNMAELTVSIILPRGTLWGFPPSKHQSSKVDFQKGIFFPDVDFE